MWVPPNLALRPDTMLALATTSRRTQRMSDWLVFDGQRGASRCAQASSSVVQALLSFRCRVLSFGLDDPENSAHSPVFSMVWSYEL